LALDLAERAWANAEPPAQRIVAVRQRSDAEQVPQNLLFVLRELSKILLDQRHVLPCSFRRPKEPKARSKNGR
jgi:hypothetical protein